MCFCNLNKFIKYFMLLMLVIFLQINLNFSVLIFGLQLKTLTLNVSIYYMRFTIEGG